MSLKAFHLIFVTAASALAFGFGVWLLRGHGSPEGVASDLAGGIASLGCGVALLVYEAFFLKKLKGVSYL